jgi:hypothetical protein
MVYYRQKFGDPLIYSHAHGRAFHHEPSLSLALWPDGRMLIQSIWAEPNCGLFLAAALLWFALGHRAGLRRFTRAEQAYWYGLFFGTIAISIVGSAGLAYGGNSRYMLTVLPVFFAMAGVMSGRVVVIALWLFMSLHHYYDGSMCFYLSQNDPARGEKCSFARHFRSDELNR